MLRSLLVRGV